jgi:nitrite reductase (NADH) small subunit
MTNTIAENIFWFLACKTSDVAENLGACIKYRSEQIAIFNFARRGEWYATQNLCPHRRQMALGRGMIGSTLDNEPKVACPFHKKTFSLVDGHCITDEHECSLKTYPVKVEDDKVFVGISKEDMDMDAYGF